MDIKQRGLVIGLPAAVIAADVDLGRLVRRQAQLFGRATSVRSETELQRHIDDANRRVDSLIERIEADRRRPNVPPELRSQVERFKAGPGKHGYVWVALADVPQATRDAVADGVRRAVNRLEGFPASSDVTPPLPTPTVRYFRLSRDGEKADFTDRRVLDGRHVLGSNTIDVRGDVSAAEARRTIVHECYHWGGDDRFRRSDDDAERFRESLVI